jgi:hypothetical protein
MLYILCSAADILFGTPPIVKKIRETIKNEKSPAVLFTRAFFSGIVVV